MSSSSISFNPKSETIQPVEVKKESNGTDVKVKRVWAYVIAAIFLAAAIALAPFTFTTSLWIGAAVIPLALASGGLIYYARTLRLDVSSIEKGGQAKEASFKLPTKANIPQNLIEKIKQLMPKIQLKEKSPEIEWLSKRTTEIFRLTEAPHLVFKMFTSQNIKSMINTRMLNGEEQIKNRFDNTIKAREVCLTHKLGLITIPQATMFHVETEGRTYPVIAEQSLDIQATESAQEELYRKFAGGLGQTVRQLVTFIAKTGFNDVVWRNVPILDSAPEFQGARRVALIDLEHMEDAKEGISGSSNGSRGLVGCLFSEEDIDAALAEARQQGLISQEQGQRIKAKRLEEIQSARQLLEFHQRNGILENHRKSLQVDLNTLGLNLNEEAEVEVEYVTRNGTDDKDYFELRSQRVTMREVAKATVDEINKLIQKTADDESVKGKRYVLLNINRGIIRKYSQLGGDERSSWLHKIIDALVAKGHLFQLVKVNGHGYFIQA